MHTNELVDEWCEQGKALEDIVSAIILWAKTPCDHSGNPYTYEFVKLASEWQEKKEMG